MQQALVQTVQNQAPRHKYEDRRLEITWFAVGIGIYIQVFFSTQISPSHLLVLRVSTSPNMHFSDPRGNPAVSQHREIIFTICCTAYAARNMLIVWWSQKQCPTLLDSWELRDDALSTWTPRLTWSKRPSWGSSHRCWNSWCWLLLKKNEELVIFCNF